MGSAGGTPSTPVERRPENRGGGLGGNFWRFAAAYTGIALADGVRVAALPRLAASISRVPLAVAAVAAAETVPWLVANLPSGVLVDRHDRRQIMQAAAVLRIVLMVVLIVTVLAHLVSIGLLIGLGFLLGCADTFGANASVGLVRGLVRLPQLEKANGVVGGVNSVGTNLVGPALGSILWTSRSSGCG